MHASYVGAGVGSVKMTPPAAPPGWYPIPGDATRVGYWDGASWTAAHDAPGAPPRPATDSGRPAASAATDTSTPRAGAARTRHLLWSIPLAAVIASIVVIVSASPSEAVPQRWEVGACVAGQVAVEPADGEDVRVVDCDSPHSGRIVEIVSDPETCPDETIYFLEAFNAADERTGEYFCIAPPVR